MTSVICSGNHSTIKTKKQWKEHIKKIMNEGGYGCLDCLCGIGFTDRKGNYWSIE